MKFKNNRVEKICNTFKNLEIDAAKELDRSLIYFFALEDQKDIKPVDYLITLLSQHIKICKNKDTLIKCKDILCMYETNNDSWKLSESNFCFIAYVFTGLSLMKDILCETFECLNKFVHILPLILIVLSLMIGDFLYKKLKKNEMYKLFCIALNRYISSLTIITLLLYYLLEALKCNVFIRLVVLLILIMTTGSYIIYRSYKYRKIAILLKNIKNSSITERYHFKTDFREQIAPPSKIKFDILKSYIPENQDVYFISKWHEIYDKYEAARLLLTKSQDFNFSDWFTPINNPLAETGIELKVKSYLFESALINYNILVDLTWTWVYVCAEYVIYKFDNQGNIINKDDITGMHTIDEAYEMLRKIENGVTTPHHEENPFNFLKKMQPQFSSAIDIITDFWHDFSNSEIRNLYNFSKHKGQLRYEEIKELENGKFMSITLNGETCPSDISDVEKTINLEEYIKKLVDFDDNKLCPYIKQLIEALKIAVNPSEMVR